MPAATLSVKPPLDCAGAAAAPPPADCPAALPHAGHAAALSAICPPQAAQNRGILNPPKFCCQSFDRPRPEAAHRRPKVAKPMRATLPNSPSESKGKTLVTHIVRCPER